METVLKIAIAAALPVIASVLIYIADKKTAFSKLNGKLKQYIIGTVFGAIAVFGTEFGIDIGGAMINVRDAAPLCAGLIFGAPAGIIAGLIGGIERYFAVYWGVGAYTQIACSVSTIIAGVFGALLRKYMFDDKKPTWYYGLAIGLVTEVVHMLMVFLTNMSDTQRAFTVVEMCALPMILSNGLSVMFSVLFVSLIGKEKLHFQKHQKKISQSFQRWLLVCVIIAFLCTSVFTYVLQTGLSETSASSLLSLNIKDVEADISDASDKNLLAITRAVAEDVDAMDEITNAKLLLVAQKNKISEIDVIDQNGIITYCTNSSFIGYNMADGAQSAEFLVLLSGTKELVQDYQPISYNTALWRKYAGVALASGGFVQVGYDARQFQSDIDKQVIGATENRHVGENGCVIICDEDFNIVSDRSDYKGRTLPNVGISFDSEKHNEWEIFSAEVDGEKSLCMYCSTEGYYIIGVLPYVESVFLRNVSVYVSAFMEIIVFAVMFALIYFLIKKLVVDNIKKINETLSKITGGDLNVTVDVRSNEEFSSLSDDINSTVLTLKRYIAEAAARIDKELEFARSIQHSALPSVFPPYPNRREFDIYAQMHTAKEVGGDFYDFYFLNKHTLAFLIADVSGKGIPAAMFMMTSKTLIKSLAEAGGDVSDVFTQANEKLCENNDAGMFVTAWMGVLDLKTGHVTFANAGHNLPLVRHSNGSFEYLKSRPNFVLAGMEGIRYGKNELELLPGDELYLYTDGVTEATNASNELYGEDRLINILNLNRDEDVESLCKLVKEDVDKFVADAPQFDDITMLTLKYKGDLPQ